MEPFTAKKKGVTITGHAIAWIVLFSLPYLLKPSYGDPHKPQPPHNFFYDLHYIFTCISSIGLFYLNAGVLIPRFLNKRKYKLYFGGILFSIGILILINEAVFRLMIPEVPFSLRGALLFYFFISLFILSCSTAYKTLLDKDLQDKKNKEKETENLKTELSFLRSQVGPHFMFNVLNNMVALARKKSDALEPSLIKLSSLLRYMLYETDEEKVPLDKEIDYLNSYMDLQNQRFGKKVSLLSNFEKADKLYWIAPMLLIPFVENAYKHGTGMVNDAFIEVRLIAVNDLLSFSVANKFNATCEEVMDKTSGIGLTNVSRRLNLLYPGKHSLKILKNQDVFKVSLQLHLD